MLASVPGTATLTNGLLEVCGDDQDNTILLTPIGSDIFVSGDFLDTPLRFAQSEVTSIEVVGGAGNDTLIASGLAVDIVMRGEAGDDTLIGGRGDDTLSGGAGDDRLFGIAGADALNGGDGSDLLIGGSGADTLSGDGGDDILTGDLDNDTLSGGAGNDVLLGGLGNDALDGGAGQDTLVGGVGDDRLEGNDDDDRLFGVDGGDEILAGNGSDLAFGGAGPDRLWGEAGDDVLVGGAGANAVLGGDGADRLVGGIDRDVLIGGDGLDSLDGGSGEDILVANASAVDDDEVELESVITTWANGDTYENRVASLLSRLAVGVAVQTDAQPDRLEGGGGSDWFVSAADDDVLLDQANEESVTGRGITAVPDNYAVDQNAALNVGSGSESLLANDRDSANGTLTVDTTPVRGPAQGTLVLQANGGFQYTPNAGFSGSDSFVYQVMNSSGATAEALVTVAVRPPNAAPTASNDKFTLDEDGRLDTDTATSLLANDVDSDGDALTVSTTPLFAPANGTLTLATDGTFSYVPDGDFSGIDGFAYEVRDTDGLTSTATVTLTVNARNDAPLATADRYPAFADTLTEYSSAAGLLQNDRDPDADTLVASLFRDATNGTVTVDADGSFTYRSDNGFVGVDTFEYQVSDGNSTSTETVTLSVAASVDRVQSFSVAEDATAGTLVGTVTTSGGAEAIFDFDRPQVADDLQLVADDHFSGDTAAPVVLIEYLDFQCPICAIFHPIVQQLKQDFDGELLVVTRHLPLESIHPNATEAAQAAEAAGLQGQFDAMGDLLFTNQAEWNTLADPLTQFETYASQLGLDVGQFRSDYSSASVAARVARDRDAAFSRGDTGTPTFYLDGAKISNPSGADAFTEIIQDAVDAFDEPFLIDRLTGDLLVSSNATLDFESDAYASTRIRAAGESVGVLVELTNSNDLPPIGRIDTYGVNEGSTFVASAVDGVLANDSDPDGAPLTATLITQTRNGTLALASDGGFTYIPDVGFRGLDQFTYVVNDGLDSSAAISVTLVVG